MHLVAELLVDGDVYPVAVPGEAFEQPLEVAVVLVVELLYFECYGRGGVLEHVFDVWRDVLEEVAVGLTLYRYKEIRSRVLVLVERHLDNPLAEVFAE